MRVLDLAWPDGLQPGPSEPVALLLDEPLTREILAQQDDQAVIMSKLMLAGRAGSHS